MKKITFEHLILIYLLLFSIGYVSCDSVHNIFNSLRRADYSDEESYHFGRVTNYKRITEPVLYVDGHDDGFKVIVGFNNMIIFGQLKDDHHFVATVNEDLIEDVNDVPQFFNVEDSGELFEIVTLKPTITTTTAKPLRSFRQIVEQTQRDVMREFHPDFDPDKGSFTDFLVEVGQNARKMANSVDNSKD